MESITTGAATTWPTRMNLAAAWGARHWLLFANLLVLLYGGLPWLSPLAYAAGWPWLGQALFLVYTPLCHQLPERSFFLFGHQVAFCHREVALYSTLLACGLLFAFVRKRLPPAPLWLGVVLLLPILFDGLSHFFDDLFGLGLRGGGDAIGSLNFWLRMLTGALAAIAIALVAYPRLERDFGVAQRRAEPS